MRFRVVFRVLFRVARRSAFPRLPSAFPRVYTKPYSHLVLIIVIARLSAGGNCEPILKLNREIMRGHGDCAK